MRMNMHTLSIIPQTLCPHIFPFLTKLNLFQIHSGSSTFYTFLLSCITPGIFHSNALVSIEVEKECFMGGDDLVGCVELSEETQRDTFVSGACNWLNLCRIDWDLVCRGNSQETWPNWHCRGNLLGTEVIEDTYQRPGRLYHGTVERHISHSYCDRLHDRKDTISDQIMHFIKATVHEHHPGSRKTTNPSILTPPSPLPPRSTSLQPQMIPSQSYQAQPYPPQPYQPQMYPPQSCQYQQPPQNR